MVYYDFCVMICTNVYNGDIRSVIVFNQYSVTPVKVVEYGSKTIPSNTQGINLCITKICLYIYDY